MAHSSMTRNDWIRFGTVIVVLFGSIFLLRPFWPLKDVVSLGLDLQGGVRMVLQAQGIEQMPADKQRATMDQIIEILTNRVDQYGLSNAEIKRLGTDRILVNLPGTQDPEEARRLIGQTALLEFHKVLDAGSTPQSELVPTSSSQVILLDRDGIPYLVEEDPLLTGDALSDAKVGTSQQLSTAGQLFISLTFSEEGAQKFVDALRSLKVNDRLAIVLDGTVYSAPRVTDSIKEAASTGGWRAVKDTTTISGQFTKEEAKRIATVLRAGALPPSILPLEEETVGPPHGSDSIRMGMITVAIGFILILVYMLIYYRVLGIVADLAVFLNFLIIFAALKLTHSTLTLPGIAGVVLSIGMSVDANVIIFERVKEERRAGKAPLAAARAGFPKSLSAIADSNIVTALTAVILLFLGTGPVKGFAITLLIGIVGSLYSALVLSRLLLEKAGFAERVPVKVSSRTSG